MVTLTNKDSVRFWEKVDIRSEDECWYWKAAIDPKHGYGVMGIKSNNFLAHRLSYMFYNEEPIPDGMLVLHSHKCIENAKKSFGDGKRSRACCNPYHLRLGTSKDNSNDTKSQGRMKGLFPLGIHKYFGENHGQHRLSSSQVETIRKDHRTQREIAQEFGINQSTVNRIKNGLRRRDG